MIITFIAVSFNKTPLPIRRPADPVERGPSLIAKQVIVVAHDALKR